jgi:hypothetical protein
VDLKWIKSKKLQTLIVPSFEFHVLTSQFLVRDPFVQNDLELDLEVDIEEHLDDVAFDFSAFVVVKYADQPDHMLMLAEIG